VCALGAYGPYLCSCDIFFRLDLFVVVWSSGAVTHSHVT